MLLLAVAGCSQSMTVQTGFPTPVLEPLPLVVGIRYPEALTNFVHQEAPPLESRVDDTPGSSQ